MKPISIILFLFFCNLLFSQEVYHGKSIENEYAICIEQSANIRNEPNINSSVLRIINFGQKVRIIEKSNTTYKLSNIDDFWYKIESDNITGYIWGGVISDEYFSFQSITSKQPNLLALKRSFIKYNLPFKIKKNDWTNFIENPPSYLNKIESILPLYTDVYNEDYAVLSEDHDPQEIIDLFNSQEKIKTFLNSISIETIPEYKYIYYYCIGNTNKLLVKNKLDYKYDIQVSIVNNIIPNIPFIQITESHAFDTFPRTFQHDNFFSITNSFSLVPVLQLQTSETYELYYFNGIIVFPFQDGGEKNCIILKYKEGNIGVPETEGSIYYLWNGKTFSKK